MPQLFVLGVVLATILAYFSINSQRSAQPTPLQPPFTFVFLPDTQIYARDNPEIFYAQTKWIASRVKQRNIVFVGHEGDIVDEYNDEGQWKVASTAMAYLDGVVPYGIAPGNHDLSPNGTAQLYTKYFPISRLQKNAGWGGSFLGDSGPYAKSPTIQDDKNTYRLFSAGGAGYIAFNLDFCPTNAVIDWTGNVLDQYRNRRAIITTHSFLDGSGNRQTTKACQQADHEGRNSGQEIWNRLVADGRHPNIWLFESGHEISAHTGGARRVDTVHGRKVYQILANYQEFTGGGDGYLRIMTFLPEQHKVRVQTYSPYLHTYMTDPANQFELSDII